MKLILQRLGHDKESTIGVLLDVTTKKVLCWILEDQPQKAKVKGETRVWAGTYDLKIREEITPLTQKYIDKYPWFKRHIEAVGIKGFIGVYLHIGNDDNDTEGCLIFGDTANNIGIERGFVGKSTQAMQRVYPILYDTLKSGKRITIEIRDEERLY